MSLLLSSLQLWLHHTFAVLPHTFMHAPSHLFNNSLSAWVVSSLPFLLTLLPLWNALFWQPTYPLNLSLKEKKKKNSLQCSLYTFVLFLCPHVISYKSLEHFTISLIYMGDFLFHSLTVWLWVSYRSNSVSPLKLGKLLLHKVWG